MDAPRPLALAALVAAALALSPRAARADACAAPGPEAGAPVRAALGPADFGAVPEACGRYELSLRGHLGLLIAEDDFYGNVAAGGALRGRILLPGGSWVSATQPGVVYRFVANATVEAESVDISAATLGWHQPLAIGDALQIAPYARVLLPTETVLENAARYGLEQGIGFVASLHEMVELTGGYSLPLLLTSTAGRTASLLMPLVALDLGFRPWRWLEVLGGGALRLVPTDPEPFESFDARASLRFYPHDGLLIDLAAAFPVGGRDRTLAGAGLALGWVGGAGR